jgi:hypothetical protein
MPIGTNPVSSSSVVSPVFKVEKVLTNAQMLLLDSNDVDLISLPAGNYMLLPILVAITTNIVTAYTNLNAAATIQVEYQGIAFKAITLFDNAVATLLVNLLAVGSFFAIATASTLTGTTVGNLTTLRSTTDNKLVISMTNAAAGNLTGGNANNQVAVQVFYVEVPLIL